MIESAPAPLGADAMFTQVYERLKAMAGRRLAMGSRDLPPAPDVGNEDAGPADIGEAGAQLPQRRGDDFDAPYGLRVQVAGRDDLPIGADRGRPGHPDPVALADGAAVAVA